MERYKSPIPALVVQMVDIKNVLEPYIERPLLFVLREAINLNRYFVCKAFTLNLNRIFLLELEEVRLEEHASPHECFFDAALCSDIIATFEEMRLTTDRCCLCRMGDGDIAAMQAAVALDDDGCAQIGIVPFSNVRHL